MDKNLFWSKMFPDELSIVLTAEFELTEKDVKEALLTKEIYLIGEYYHTPIDQLKTIEANGRYGTVKLSLKQVS